MFFSRALLLGLSCRVTLHPQSLHTEILSRQNRFATNSPLISIFFSICIISLGLSLSGGEHCLFVAEVQVVPWQKLSSILPLLPQVFSERKDTNQSAA